MASLDSLRLSLIWHSRSDEEQSHLWLDRHSLGFFYSCGAVTGPCGSAQNFVAWRAGETWTNALEAQLGRLEPTGLSSSWVFFVCPCDSLSVLCPRRWSVSIEFRWPRFYSTLSSPSFFPSPILYSPYSNLTIITNHLRFFVAPKKTDELV